VNLRNSTRFSDRSSSNEPYNKRLEFDGWTYGETVTDLWLGTPDARWFKVKGTNFWVPSAYIYGNPPNSSPMPGSGAVGNVDIIAEPIHSPSDPNGTLGTAENWDVFSDRSKDEPNFIGYNGDQNDFIRFSVANNRTNVNLRLSGLSADADLQLIRDVNNNGRVDPGEVLGESLNPGISVDSVSRILDAGDYFIRVYPGVSNAKTSYNLELKSVRLAGDIQNGDRFYSAGASLWRYNSKGKMENQEEIKSNAAIESNKDTIVVIHGWNPEGKNKTIDDDATMSDLAKAAAQAYPDRQVLVLDWKSPANHWKDDVWYSDLEIKNPHHTAGAIRPVATWAKNTLEAIGLTANRISLFGHSLGSYVSAEIGRMFEKVNSIVALDPAAKGTWGGSEKYDIDGNTSGSQTIPLLFRHVANKSVAFVASDEKEGWAGDNDRAATANDSFIVRFNGDGDAVEYHGGVVQVFTDMLGRGASKIESLSGYKTDSVANNGVSYTYSLGRNIHEAVITAKKENGTWKYNQTLFIPGSDSARWV
jgi:pimeloyl-ACP methyl ester carboxylesterase